MIKVMNANANREGGQGQDSLVLGPSEPKDVVHTYVSTSIDGTGKFVPYF